jgi:hypothetical protein
VLLFKSGTVIHEYLQVMKVEKMREKCRSAQKFTKVNTTHNKTDHDETQIIREAVLVTAYSITAHNRHCQETDTAFGWTKETATSDGYDTAKSNHQK